MRIDAYTAEAICKCMGIPSFENDPACTCAIEAIRLLLKPSFHPEICLTFADGKVSMISAQSIIWRQLEPFPIFTDRDEGTIPDTMWNHLLSSMIASVSRLGAVPSAMIDGMPSELLHFMNGDLMLKVEGNASWKGGFSDFVALAITTAWEFASNPYIRNSLAEVAGYVGKSLPHEPEPPRKPIFKIMVLGSKNDREQLLEALQKHRDGQAQRIHRSWTRRKTPNLIL